MELTFSHLPESLLRTIESALTYDWQRSEDQLFKRFVAQGVPERLARQALCYRDPYQRNLYLKEYTPLRSPHLVFIFDCGTGRYIQH